MRIQIISDLHLNFYEDHGRKLLSTIYDPSEEADVLIVAGDTTPAMYLKDARSFFAKLSSCYKHIVLVHGNHDFYHTSIGKGKKIFSDFLEPFHNVHMLDRSNLLLDGKVFCGATLWFKDTPLAEPYKEDLNDFSCIDGVEAIYEEERLDTEFLASVEADVAITHHMPSRQSVEPRYRNDPLNYFFVNPLLDSPDTTAKVKLWVHGHTHTSCSYQHQLGKVVCNPVGYPWENPNYANCYETLD